MGGQSTTRIVVGLVMIAVAFIVFPIILTGAGEITSWEATTAGNVTANITAFTGLAPMVKVGPLLIFIALLLGGGVLSFSGIRATVRKKSSR